MGAWQRNTQVDMVFDQGAVRACGGLLSSGSAERSPGTARPADTSMTSAATTCVHFTAENRRQSRRSQPPIRHGCRVTHACATGDAIGLGCHSSRDARRHCSFGTCSRSPSRTIALPRPPRPCSGSAATPARSSQGGHGPATTIGCRVARIHAVGFCPGQSRRCSTVPRPSVAGGSLGIGAIQPDDASCGTGALASHSGTGIATSPTD